MSRSDALTQKIAVKREGKVLFDPRSFLSKAGNAQAISDYRANQVVYSQGDPAESVFYIQDGTAKVTVFSKRGKDVIVGLPGAGDFFGEGCLAGQGLRQATVTTRTECVIVRLAKARIIRVIREEPAFAELFISHLVARNMRVEEDLVDQLLNSSEKRLARVLLLLANFDKDQLEPIPVKISQEMLAAMVGTTRARVSFFMNKFRRLGFIEYKRHIEVRSSLLNVVLDDKPNAYTLRPHNIDGQLSLLASATDRLAGRQGDVHLRRHREAQVARLGDAHAMRVTDNRASLIARTRW